MPDPEGSAATGAILHRHKPVLAGIDRLADRIIAGDVLFFIGAGFSLDSEWNSAGRLVTRLLVRTVALASSLQRVMGSRPTEPVDLLSGLCITFGITLDPMIPGDPQSQPLLKLVNDAAPLLAQRYFEFNEWACVAFGQLLEELEPLSPKERAEVLKRSNGLEELLLDTCGNDDVPLESITQQDLARLKGLKAERGKVLFLETMGFQSQRIMASADPDASESMIRRAYGDRIKTRQLVLARLAREGLCPSVVTTNYDLLLEGAFRLVGIDDVAAPPPTSGAAQNRTGMPAARFRQYARVRSAVDWFRLGGDQRVVKILKIHGCAELYRQKRTAAHDRGAPKDVARWARVAKDLVFTYREIQNWRNDSWARDLLRTLMRSKTVVFAGYSVADPVIHNTLRDVYDELRDQCAVWDHGKMDKDLATSGSTQEDARAFFLDVEDKLDFFGSEVLRAATAAAGCDQSIGQRAHPNLLPFSIQTWLSTDQRGLGLDEIFQLLEHKVLRRLQRRAAATLLPEMSPCISGTEYPLPASEVDRFLALVDQLLKHEDEASAAEQLRSSLWTRSFLHGYLRQAAFARGVSRSGPAAWELAASFEPTAWHAAVVDYPEQAVLALILEVALRQTTVEHAPDADWRRSNERCRVRASDPPTVEVQLEDHPAPPMLVTIQFKDLPGAAGPPSPKGVFAGHRVWRFTGSGVAHGWRDAGPHTPSLQDLWAACLAETGDRANLKALLQPEPSA